MSNNTNFDDLSKYCNSIKDSKKLTREEEKELGNSIKLGDDVALNKLVTSNLKYVVRLAKRYAWSNVPINDLISEGNLALIHAAKKFNPNVGTKFITYADKWIRQAMKEYVDKYVNNMVEYGLEESYEDIEICDELINDEFVDCIHNTQSQTVALNELLSCLQERELYVLELFFGLNGKNVKSLQEIGDELGYSSERVRQIKERSIEKLQLKAISSPKYAEFKELFE